MTKRKLVSAKKSIRRAVAPKRAIDRIRDTARDLFYRQGIRAVGVDEIVTRAGVTKPSLYRSFSSKDELAADYLHHIGEEGLLRFDTMLAANPRDPRGQFMAWVADLVRRATAPGYRGCGATNAAVEYPDRKHPARKVAADIKRRFRAKLMAAAKAMGAPEPARLGDGLMLLLEGVYASGQLFGTDGPVLAVVESAQALIDHHLKQNRENL